MSVAGGLENAVRAAVDAGCDCLQIFVKNQRQWRAPSLTDEQVGRFRAALIEAGSPPVVAHASYLLNLASPKPRQRRQSIAALVDERKRCERLGVSAIMFHPGAHMGAGVEKGITRIATALDQVHRQTSDCHTRILMETTAGQGTAIGWRFEHIAAIIERVREPIRLGVCLDTCHLFAAGHDFRKPAGYTSMMDELESTLGINRVCCIHTNDSKRGPGSRIDRHDHIGKGKIGKVGFTQFVNDRRWAGIPMILETPKGKDGRGTDLDRVNLKRLRSLITR